MEKYGEIFGEDYEPSNEDVIKLRNATLQSSVTILEKSSGAGAIHIPIIDVGGLLSCRKSWKEEIPSATIVVFVASLAAYDQVMAEDQSVNRMVDSLVLFQELVNNLALQTEIYVVFSKKDVYDEKIKTRNIVDYFPGYKGVNGDGEQGIKYFKAKFLDVNTIGKDREARVDCYITTLTSLQECRTALGSIIQKAADHQKDYEESA